MRAKQAEAVAEIFDSLSQNYISSRERPELVREREVILDMLGAASHYDRILDIGCGPGTFFDRLLEKGRDVYGIDISERMVRVAKDRFRESPARDRIHVSAGDATMLDFSDGFFDAAVAVSVLRYMPDRETALAEIKRCLMPGGVFVCSFFFRYSPQWFYMVLLYRPFLPLINALKRRTRRSLRLHWKAEPLPFSYRMFIRALADLGFRIDRVYHSGFSFFPFDRLFPNQSSRMALTLEYLLHDSPIFGWLGSVCIVKAEKLR